MGRAGMVVALTAVGALMVALYIRDPEAGGLFPSCPFRSLTGLLCPGCGSLRATHDLLHGRVIEAFAHNALLVAALPLLGLNWMHRRLRPRSEPLDSNNFVVGAWLVAIVAWGVLRNTHQGACMAF
jgi:hypothetical protein